MTEHDFIKEAFKNLNDNVLILSQNINGTSREMAELKGEFSSFRREVLRHFDTCPVDELREHTGQIDVAIERLNAKKSDPKISRPPAARGVSDRTLQLIAILAIIAIGGGTLLMQVFS
jgi:hypothetical protein